MASAWLDHDTCRPGPAMIRQMFPSRIVPRQCSQRLRFSTRAPAPEPRRPCRRRRYKLAACLRPVSFEAVIAACRCASKSSLPVFRVLRHIMMIPKPSIRFLLLSWLLSSATARSFSRDDNQHGFPQLQARNGTGLAPSSINGTLTNSTGAILVPQIPLACNFTQEVTFKVREPRRAGPAGLGCAWC